MKRQRNANDRILDFISGSLVIILAAVILFAATACHVVADPLPRVKAHWETAECIVFKLASRPWNARVTIVKPTRLNRTWVTGTQAVLLSWADGVNKYRFSRNYTFRSSDIIEYADCLEVPPL